MKVDEGLRKKARTVFLPRILVPSRRRDRKRMIRVPLFPGYTFVRTDMNPVERLDILKTAGVVRFIGNADGPLPVPESAIESLRLMVATDLDVQTGNRLRKGDLVVVVQGPFTGVTGVLVRYRGKGRVVVNVDALGQNASVEVSAEDVERVPPVLKR